MGLYANRVSVVGMLNRKCMIYSYLYYLWNINIEAKVGNTNHQNKSGNDNDGKLVLGTSHLWSEAIIKLELIDWALTPRAMEIYISNIYF